MSIEPVLSRRLRIANCFLAAVPTSLIAGASTLHYVLSVERPYWGEGNVALSAGIGTLYVASSLLGTWAAIWMVLLVLTTVERAGLRLFGRVHKNRVTPTVALALTSHASVGWLVGGVLVAAGIGVGLWANEIAMHRNVDMFRGVMMLAPIWMPVAGGFVGLLTFEAIVYLGVRECRFANRAKPDA